MFASLATTLENDNDRLEISYLPVEAVKPNPYQPRKFFDRAGLLELASSIKEYGVMQPITVRRARNGTYELIAGERRLRASKIAGLAVIPAIIVQANEQESAVIAMIENLQRQNLNFVEEAEGYLNLIQDYAFTQEVLAAKLGKSQSTIANKIRVLKLPKEILRTILENDLTERHARALLRLDDERSQMEVLAKVVKGGFTVKKTEELIETLMQKAETSEDDKTRDENTRNENTRRVRVLIRHTKAYTNEIVNIVARMKEAGLAADCCVEESESGVEMMISVNY